LKITCANAHVIDSSPRAHRYGELESSTFSEALSAQPLPDASAVAADPEAAVAGFSAAAEAAEVAAAAALRRCSAATGLAGLPELLLVADEELARHVSRLQVGLAVGFRPCGRPPSPCSAA
jgi:hypothetical protein